uniref:RRM domain-containing protein n=1 Tax=Panthera leo TaxID=9689 RepID=A0A8C8WSB4_PANLE
HQASCHLVGGVEEKTKVYVGSLGTSVSRGELERAFGYYSILRTVWIMRNPPRFTFVEFEDPRYAEDAMRGLGREVMILRSVSSSPASGSVLTAQSLEPVSDSVSPSL